MKNLFFWNGSGRPALIAVFLLPVAVFCQQIAVDLDTAATKINWSLGGNVHSVHGTFQLKQGQVNFDPSNGIASGELVVETASGESGNASRDKRMKKDVLEVDRFPEVRLNPTKFEGRLPLRNGSSVRLIGRFVIRGTSHEVSIPLKITLNGTDVSAQGNFVVPYVDWGMKDPSNFLFKVNKTVEIELLAVGHVARSN